MADQQLDAGHAAPAAAVGAPQEHSRAEFEQSTQQNVGSEAGSGGGGFATAQDKDSNIGKMMEKIGNKMGSEQIANYGHAKRVERGLDEEDNARGQMGV